MINWFKKILGLKPKTRWLRIKDFDGFTREINKNEYGLQGLERVYYPSGELCAEKFYRNNELHGEYKRYYKNGNLAEKSFYDDDLKKAEIKEYYKNGAVYQIKTLKNKKVVLELKLYKDGSYIPKNIKTERKTIDDEWRIFIDDILEGDVNSELNSYSCKNSEGTTYYLNSKDVTIKFTGQVQTIYFFSKDKRSTGLDSVPAGKVVCENDRTLLPFLKSFEDIEADDIIIDNNNNNNNSLHFSNGQARHLSSWKDDYENSDKKNYWQEWYYEDGSVRVFHITFRGKQILNMSYYEDGSIKIICVKNDTAINELIENEGIAKYALKLNLDQINRLKAVVGVDLKENNEGKINDDAEVVSYEQMKNVLDNSQEYQELLNKYKDTINNKPTEDVLYSVPDAIELTEKEKELRKKVINENKVKFEFLKKYYRNREVIYELDQDFNDESRLNILNSFVNFFNDYEIDNDSKYFLLREGTYKGLKYQYYNETNQDSVVKSIWDNEYNYSDCGLYEKVYFDIFSDVNNCSFMHEFYCIDMIEIDIKKLVNNKELQSLILKIKEYDKNKDYINFGFFDFYDLIPTLYKSSIENLWLYNDDMISWCKASHIEYENFFVVASTK